LFAQHYPPENDRLAGEVIFWRIVLMPYSRGSHTAFHHRYHIVWAPKYRFKVLHGEVRLRVREIIRQVCSELGVKIIHGVLSRDHVHMFVEIPPHIAVSDFVRRAKGRSSRKIQQEFEHIRKRYWGQRFWQRGYFSTTSGNITDGAVPKDRAVTFEDVACGRSPQATSSKVSSYPD
jgi:putative transposase